MASENENEKRKTVTDILAEYRNDADAMDRGELYQPTTEYVRRLLDRIDAAWKREKADAEANALAVGGVVEAARHKPFGNAAAMREALLKCREIALQWQADEADGVAGTTDKPQARSAAEAVIDMEFEINAALSAPPRNCDVGTADEKCSRRGRYCRSHLCGKCEFGRETDDIDDEQSCIVRWMVSPYAEEGGEK